MKQVRLSGDYARGLLHLDSGVVFISPNPEKEE